MFGNRSKAFNKDKQGKERYNCDSCDGNGYSGKCLTCAAGIKTDGDMALSAGDPQRAISLYLKAITYDREFSELWNNLGGAYGMSGDHTKALDAYEQALKIRPDYINALVGKAVAQEKLGRFEGALETYDVALKLNDHPEIRNFRQRVLNKTSARTQ